jgi:polyhydroxyalkanoate synthesis regulator phasin
MKVLSRIDECLQRLDEKKANGEYFEFLSDIAQDIKFDNPRKFLDLKVAMASHLRSRYRELDAMKDQKVVDDWAKKNKLMEEESKIDWNEVKQAMVDAAKDIHDKADMKIISNMIDGVKKKNPKDTEDAIQIGINMMRSGS